MKCVKKINSKFKSWQSVFVFKTSFVHFINIALQISVLAIESKRTGQVRKSSEGKRLQIVSARCQDPLKFHKSTASVFIDHGMSFEVCDFIEVVCDG